MKGHQKVGFLSMRGSKITATKKKKEQGEGKEEKKKKAMVALLVLIIVTLEIPKIDREKMLYTQF